MPINVGKALGNKLANGMSAMRKGYTASQYGTQGFGSYGSYGLGQTASQYGTQGFGNKLANGMSAMRKGYTAR